MDTLDTLQPIDPEKIHAEIQELQLSYGTGTLSTAELKMAFGLIDLTTLEGNDTESKIKVLCGKAIKITQTVMQLPKVAAICVYPVLVRRAKEELVHSGIKVAAVAGGFPSGQIPLKLKLAEIAYALNEGADEVDVTFSRKIFLEGKYGLVMEELEAMRACCGTACMKVILETGELGSLANIRKASDMALNAGADFIKTSTGKISVSATPAAVYVMAESIKFFYEKTGKAVGIKPAGGISDLNLMKQYINIVKSKLGESWLNPGMFRFGASRLTNMILNELGSRTGNNTRENYF